MILGVPLFSETSTYWRHDNNTGVITNKLNNNSDDECENSHAARTTTPHTATQTVWKFRPQRIYIYMNLILYSTRFFIGIYFIPGWCHIFVWFSGFLFKSLMFLRLLLYLHILHLFGWIDGAGVLVTRLCHVLDAEVHRRRTTWKRGRCSHGFFTRWDTRQAHVVFYIVMYVDYVDMRCSI